MGGLIQNTIMQPQDDIENQTTSLNLNSGNLQIKGLNSTRQIWVQNECMGKSIREPLQLNPKPTE